MNPYLPASLPRHPPTALTTPSGPSRKVVPLLFVVLSRAERPHRAYYRHYRLPTMLLYTALADLIAKTATLFSEAQLFDRVLARLCELNLTRFACIVTKNFSLIRAVNSSHTAVRCWHRIESRIPRPRCSRYPLPPQKVEVTSRGYLSQE